MYYHPGDTAKDYKGMEAHHYCVKLHWISDDTIEKAHNEDMDPYINCIWYMRQE